MDPPAPDTSLPPEGRKEESDPVPGPVSRSPEIPWSSSGSQTSVYCQTFGFLPSLNNLPCVITTVSVLTLVERQVNGPWEPVRDTIGRNRTPVE